MKFFIGVLALALSALAVSGEKARFDNYRVYTVDVETHDQLTVLKQLSETSDSYSFWEEPQAVNTKADIVVPPHKFAHFSELVEKFQFNVELTNANFQEAIDKETPEKKQRKSTDAAIDWTEYYSVADIFAWVDSLQAEFPGIITVETIGTTYENRPMKLVKLSKKTGNRAVFIEANMHAREWISSATATYVLNQLLRSTDPEVQFIAENVDWYIIPVTNPDGYEYTRSTNRNWRKTRAPASLICDGIDGNRNFAFNWLIADETGNLGASTNPCSDTFAGPRAHSEPEAQAVDNFLRANAGKFDIYLAFHSYAHQILFPMGNTAVRIRNYAQHQEIGNAAAARLFATHGIQYEVGNSREVLYATSGTSVDHAMGAYGIPIGYTYEMRGNGAYGRFGFVLPPVWIIPNGQEVLNSLIGMVMKSRDLGYLV